MAEDMQSGVCSGNWWARSGTSSGYGGTSASPCVATAAMSEIGSYSWSSDITEIKARSVGESVDNHSASISVGSTMVFQEPSHKTDTNGVLMDSSLQLVGFGLSAPAAAPDWSHVLMRGSGRSESSLQEMLQDEDLNSRATFPQDPSIPSSHFQKDWTSGDDSNISSLKQIHQHNLFGLEQRLNSSECSATGRNIPINISNYGYPSTMMQGYVDQDSPLLSLPSMNYRLSSQSLFSDEFPQNWSKFPQFLKPSSSSSSSPPKQHINNQLQFTNNAPFWNASITMTAEIRPTLYAPSASQFLSPTFEEKPSIQNVTAKRNSEEIGDASSSDLKKSSTTESTFKRPRLETPSPLPTFKVRKEKLGDRITALQQLVSPFGKTDTASVLHEAIQYIKFLHDQVNALSNPYMKSGVQMQHQHPQNSGKSKDPEGPKQDLRSRGLCLVPISSTFPMNNETAADFWTPTFGGHYR